MAVSEERNRLARDLHDSAKQQALAASFELGTALTLYERDPDEAKKHLAEADTLVDSVRKELTNLVDELRPQSMDGEDFSEILKEYGMEWSHRSGIELNFHVEGNDEIIAGDHAKPYFGSRRRPWQTLPVTVLPGMRTYPWNMGKIPLP